MSDSLWLHELQHARPPCPSPSPGVCLNSCSFSQWYHPTISSSVIPFSPCIQSFSASRSFLVNWLFTSGGQSIGASASVFPIHIQGLYCLGLATLISLLSKEFSRVFSSTTVWKHQIFSAQPSLSSNSHIHTWLLEKIIALTIQTYVGKVIYMGEENGISRGIYEDHISFDYV